MKCDPSTACVNRHEVLRWAVVHDVLAHPLLALTGYAKFAVRFHDWTSSKAWPRLTKSEPEPVVLTAWLPGGQGLVVVTQVNSRIYKVRHPYVDHVYTCEADDRYDALQQGELWFASLRREVGL